MASGSGDNDFIADIIAVDKTAPDGFARQIVILGKPGVNAAQTDLDTLVGGLTETAPASDTASSGLNGRSQRIAQNITTLIGRLPASLGQKVASLSLSMVLASDQILATLHQVLAPTTVAWTSAIANNTALSLAVTGYNSVVVGLQSTSTFTAGTITFETSYNGSDWYPIAGIRLDAATIESSYAIVASTVRVWQFNVAGLQNFRVRLSPAITGTGTANLSIQASAARVSPLTVVGGTVATSLAMAASWTTSVSTVTNATAVNLLSANSNRKAFKIMNHSDSDLFLASTNAVVAAGTNGDVLLGRTPTAVSVYTGAVWAIVGTGQASATVRVSEYA